MDRLLNADDRLIMDEPQKADSPIVDALLNADGLLIVDLLIVDDRLRVDNLPNPRKKREVTVAERSDRSGRPRRPSVLPVRCSKDHRLNVRRDRRLKPNV